MHRRTPAERPSGSRTPATSREPWRALPTRAAGPAGGGRTPADEACRHQLKSGIEALLGHVDGPREGSLQLASAGAAAARSFIFCPGPRHPPGSQSGIIYSPRGVASVVQQARSTPAPTRASGENPSAAAPESLEQEAARDRRPPVIGRLRQEHNSTGHSKLHHTGEPSTARRQVLATLAQQRATS